jgi:hypothetical protein
MPRYQRLSREKRQEVDPKRKVRQKVSGVTSERSDSRYKNLVSLNETSAQPQMDIHAELLSQSRSDEEMTNFVMQLQRTYGNSYVQRLMESMRAQAKLTVSNPNDVYEQEADRVAKVVTRAIDAQLQLQAEPEKEEEEAQMKLDTPRSITGNGQIDPGIESSRQPALGNAHSLGGLIQRMAVIVADDFGAEKDTLVWNNLQNAIAKAGGPVGDLQAHKVWDKVGKDTEIRLVGHGKEDVPEIVPNIKTIDIVKSMTEGPRKLKDPDKVRIKEVTFQSCYAGIGPISTMVGEMKALLEAKGYGGVIVKGEKRRSIWVQGLGRKNGKD